MAQAEETGRRGDDDGTRGSDFRYNDRSESIRWTSLRRGAFDPRMIPFVQIQKWQMAIKSALRVEI